MPGKMATSLANLFPLPERGWVLCRQMMPKISGADRKMKAQGSSTLVAMEGRLTPLAGYFYKRTNLPPSLPSLSKDKQEEAPPIAILYSLV